MRRPVVTICGSTRFEQEIIEARKQWTLRGYIVLGPELFGHGSDSMRVDDELKQKLDQLHRDKIEMADIVYVVNPGGYIGTSTLAEIKYAISLGKDIQYMEVI